MAIGLLELYAAALVGAALGWVGCALLSGRQRRRSHAQHYLVMTAEEWDAMLRPDSAVDRAVLDALRDPPTLH